MTAREALAQEWRERFDDFAESEMTVQDWCDFNRLSIHQYYYWRRRLAPTQPQPPANPSFLALDIVDTPPFPAAPGGVTIRIAGAAIEVTSGFDPAMLRAVVGALATPSC
jgi:hypothetical protein